MYQFCIILQSQEIQMVQLCLTIERIVSSHVKYTTKWWQLILVDSITGINELELGGESSSKLLVKVNTRVI